MFFFRSAFLICILGSSIGAQDIGFKWLIGTWKMESEKVNIFERWQQDNGRLKGEGYSIKNDQKKVSETLFLEKFNNQWALIALPVSQTIALFALTSADSGRFVFENKEHDFPQRITYAYDGKSAIQVYVEGDADGQLKKMTFKLIRQEK